MQRQFSIHSYLPKHLKGLCSDSVPLTSQLFRDNITASMKEAKELDKLINTPGTSGYQPHCDNRCWNSHHSDNKQRPRAKEQQQAALHTKETLREQRAQAVLPQESLDSESSNKDQVKNMNTFTFDEVDEMKREATCPLHFLMTLSC